MRALVLFALIAACLGLAGCRGSESYSQQDLQQVHQVYAELRPMYETFKRAFMAGDAAEIFRIYAEERAPCSIVDQIDNRDTIDPNVALFQASITLDDLCNAIESGYAEWAVEHHRPYPKDLQPLRPSELFVGAEADLKKMNGYLRHPSALA
jgi:hypothetical protein